MNAGPFGVNEQTKCSTSNKIIISHMLNQVIAGTRVYIFLLVMYTAILVGSCIHLTASILNYLDLM
jgi:hypothetical protein